MASLMRTALLLLLVVLILHETDGWRRRRRRRRRCHVRNCQVGSWSPWSSCSTRCGSTGSQYRTRRKTVSESCGGRCPYNFREVRGCNRNACQNGGSPAPGYCRCPVRFKGTCCEIVMTTTAVPTTTEMPTTAAPTTTMPTTTEAPTTTIPTTTEAPTTMEFTTTPRTFPPKPTTSSLCFCYNGGTPVCRFGRLQYCRCRRGFNGPRCQYVYTTRRPFTATPARHLKCYRCLSLNKSDCTSKTQYCPSKRYVCYAGQYTLRNSGRTVYAAGCVTPDTCQTGCDRAGQSGKVTRCSIRCCRSDLCNDFTKPTPKRNHLLRMLLKLLEIFKLMIEAIEAVIKIGLDSNLADYHKREIVSMMKRVDDTALQIEDSSEPAVLQAKQSVAEMRMRAMEALEKLNNYIDADPEKK